MRNLKWFEARVGKRIFRDPNTCKCHVCKDVVDNGLIIVDDSHAYYIYASQGDYKHDIGEDLNYRDKK